MTTPADTLRQAAALMSEDAEKATEGPWFLSDCEGEIEVWREGALRHVSRDADGTITGYSLPGTYQSSDLIYEQTVDSWDSGEDESDDRVRANAEHIASWHPAVALAVADWLNTTADAGHYDTCASALSGDYPCSCPVSSALTVATTYLGTAT